MAFDLQHCRDNFRQRAAVQDAAREALRLQTREEAISAIREIVPTYPTITQVYLFGSITQPGHFTDIVRQTGELVYESPSRPAQSEH